MRVLSLCLDQISINSVLVIFRVSLCNVQSIAIKFCSVCANRWFIKFAHFIASLTFLFEFTRTAPVRPKNAHNHLSVWPYREQCMSVYAE